MSDLSNRVENSVPIEDQENPSVEDLITQIRILKNENHNLKQARSKTDTFNIVMNGLDALVYVADLDNYDLIFVNDYTKRILKLNENWNEKKCWEVIHHNQTGPCPFCPNKYLINQNGLPTGIYTWEFINTITGRWYHIQDLAIEWMDGRIVRLEIGTDITDRKEAEEKLELRTKQLEQFNRDLKKIVDAEIKKGRAHEELLIQQSRLAAMGEMIGAIAHQWRQPLNTLGLLIQDLMDASDFGQLNEEYLKSTVKNSMEQILYMSQTIDDFRNYFKPAREKSVFDLKQKIVEIVNLIKPQMKANHVSLDIDQKNMESIFIRGYPGEFQQVVLNLISNAKDAILSKRDKGDVTPDYHGVIKIILKKENAIARVLVEDNGTGISPDVMPHIFEPYFSTRGSGQGTGIGLYMSKMIIEKNMGGILEASNGDDNGAVFHINIPMLEVI